MHIKSCILPAKESCNDLDPQGCAANPDICQDPVLSVVTCPRTCNTCGKAKFFMSANMYFNLLLVPRHANMVFLLRPYGDP